MAATESPEPLVVAAEASETAVFERLQTKTFTLWAEKHFSEGILYILEGQGQPVYSFNQLPGSAVRAVEFTEKNFSGDRHLVERSAMAIRDYFTHSPPLFQHGFCTKLF